MDVCVLPYPPFRLAAWNAVRSTKIANLLSPRAEHTKVAYLAVRIHSIKHTARDASAVLHDPTGWWEGVGESGEGFDQ